MRELRGRNALVTGGSGGIGAYIARALARAGVNVVVSGRREDALALVVAELRQKGVAAEAVPGDLHEPAQVDTLIERSEAALGPLDVLVNNAGIDFTSDLLETALEDVRRVLEVNFIGAFLMLKEAARAMRRSGKGGSIINVTSRTASVGVPTMTIYGATKGALLSLTRGAAIDLARYSIRVNAVAPGLTQTPLFEAWLAAQADPEQFREATVATIPQHRFASPEDVASAILYFASDESSHVTGASLAVDGGYTAA